ncbi:MAG TPA: SbcC/MukB-like Walker B domain-containing protein [Burkholderiaceae bacterium]
MLGIDNERALRLLHKTQSAKNLGDLNVFLRDFMLDAPETFAVADRLVLEFGELNEAHQAVVAARRQIETLLPAREEYEVRGQLGRELNELAEVEAGIDHYRAAQRAKLFSERIAELALEAEASRLKAGELSLAVERESEKLDALRRRRDELGGNLLEQLQKRIEETERQKEPRMKKRDAAKAACEAMGWTLPGEVLGFVQRVDAARHHVLQATERGKALEEKRDGLRLRLSQLSAEFQATVLEVKAMERQGSNIPARLLDVRAKLAQELQIEEAQLPFAGELLEVRAEDGQWQGAIERVLGGFARSILVDDQYYAKVAAFLDRTHIGERLFYNRILPPGGRARTPGADSLFGKLKIAPGPYADWLAEELKTHFDFVCAETTQAFRAAPRALTRAGQIKHNAARHEKNDRQRVDDRSNWVLGFDNKAKLRLYQDKAADLGGKIAPLRGEIDALEDDRETQRRQDLACNTLQNMTWDDIDVASLLVEIDDLKQRIEQEKASRPDLGKLDAQIGKQHEAYRSAMAAKAAEDGTGQRIAQQRHDFQGKLDELASFEVRLTPFQLAALDERAGRTGRAVTLDTLERVLTEVERGIVTERRAIELRRVELANSIERRLAKFNELWRTHSDGLDPVLASAEDYFGKLVRLQQDGLPQFEHRFMQLLREQSDQNLTLLSSKLDQERSAIRSRMELVNESLLTAPFNKGTHLSIDTLDRSLEEVRTFRQTLKEALSHSFSEERDIVEKRFAVLNGLVKRLASEETADRNWRSQVLDVRQHVEFVARELDDDFQREVEVYRSGAGKSGGQRQKLAATCLAAALRYQLGGQDRVLPSYATVVLDEAFDKADAEFTAMAMNIFKTFGFQMIVATPLKSVMTLEPFIGGACFVHIKDRKDSAILKIDYDKATQRLIFPEQVVHAKETDLA